MSEQGWVTVVGIIVVVFQALVAIQVKALKDMMQEKFRESKDDRESLWERLYSHTHRIKCSNPGCDEETSSISFPTTRT